MITWVATFALVAVLPLAGAHPTYTGSGRMNIDDTRYDAVGTWIEGKLIPGIDTGNYVQGEYIPRSQAASGGGTFHADEGVGDCALSPTSSDEVVGSNPSVDITVDAGGTSSVSFSCDVGDLSLGLGDDELFHGNMDGTIET